MALTPPAVAFSIWFCMVVIPGISSNCPAWDIFIIICIALAVSAMYEFVEWWTSVGLGQSADEFLGTQGDNWDAQWDMFLAGCGAMCVMLFLQTLQDKSMRKIPGFGE